MALGKFSYRDWMAGWLKSVAGPDGGSAKDAFVQAVAVTDSTGAEISPATAANQVLEIADLDAIKTAVQSTNPVQTFASNSYANITTKTTTTVKSGAGTLMGIVINKLGSADTLAIYDNTAGSGTLIGTITSPTIGRLTYDVAFGTGLTIVSGGTTAGDYTVAYR